MMMISALMLVSIRVMIAFALEAYGAGAPKAYTQKSKSTAEKELKILRDPGSGEADALAEFIEK